MKLRPPNLSADRVVRSTRFGVAQMRGARLAWSGFAPPRSGGRDSNTRPPGQMDEGVRGAQLIQERAEREVHTVRCIARLHWAEHRDT